MKQFVIAGTLAGALAVGGTALAQTPPAAAAPKAAPKADTKTAPKAADTKAAPKADTAAPAQAEKPAAKPRATMAKGENSAAGHAAPKSQPGTAPEATAPDGTLPLGTVHLPKALKADGKALPAGTYTVRLTPDEAKPDAKGSSEKLERWVEFLKGGKVVGREVVSIVPKDEAKLVQKDAPPASGGAKVETLKGGDYVRVWINKGGTYYLVHLANG